MCYLSNNEKGQTAYNSQRGYLFSQVISDHCLCWIYINIHFKLGSYQQILSSDQFKTIFQLLSLFKSNHWSQKFYTQNLGPCAD